MCMRARVYETCHRIISIAQLRIVLYEHRVHTTNTLAITFFSLPARNFFCRRIDRFSVHLRRHAIHVNRVATKRTSERVYSYGIVALTHGRKNLGETRVPSRCGTSSALFASDGHSFEAQVDMLVCA